MTSKKKSKPKISIGFQKDLESLGFRLRWMKGDSTCAYEKIPFFEYQGDYMGSYLIQHNSHVASKWHGLDQSSDPLYPLFPSPSFGGKNQDILTEVKIRMETRRAFRIKMSDLDPFVKEVFEKILNQQREQQSKIDYLEDEVEALSSWKNS